MRKTKGNIDFCFYLVLVKIDFLKIMYM